MPRFKPKLPSAADQLLLDAAVEIKQNPDATETAFMARQLVQCTLPHSDPGDTPIWTRTNGNLTLVIQPHIDRQTRKALYPFGSIPRLFLFWLHRQCYRAIWQRHAATSIANSKWFCCSRRVRFA